MNSNDDLQQTQHTIASVLSEIEQRVNRNTSRYFDAILLLAHTLNVARSHLYAYPELSISTTQYAEFQQLLKRRLQGEPIAYLVGCREFWTLMLRVTKDTLIPRPETELLVELILSEYDPSPPIRLLDLGTGCGAIALALASMCPDWEIWAVDNSPAALDIAKQNAQQFSLTNVNFQCSDWFSNLPKQTFDVIVSNPPYIAKADDHLRRGDLRFEPQQALVSGSDGLAALREIIKSTPDYLRSNGRLLVEHGFTQGQSVLELMHAAGFMDRTSHKDLAGLTRATSGSCP